MAENDTVKCPYCGETDELVKMRETATFTETVCTYKCLNCDETFHY